MPVLNIGRVGANFDKLKRKAAQAVSFSPIRDESNSLLDFGMGDWDDFPTESLVFRCGIDNWASTTKRVGK